MAHVTDWSTIARLERIRIEPGESFSWDALLPAIRHALTEAAAGGLKSMQAKAPTPARVVNGWQMNTDTLGVYGNYYLKRAIVAMVGLGANQLEDAICSLNLGMQNRKRRSLVPALRLCRTQLTKLG